MEDVASLKVAQQLNSTINQLYEETIQRLEGALQSVCNDFHANQYVKVSSACTMSWVCLICCARYGSLQHIREQRGMMWQAQHSSAQPHDQYMQDHVHPEGGE